MRILVFDVPAASGGALSILTEFHKEVCTHKSKNIEWIFVLSTPILEESDNVKVLNYSWVKRSWFHRLFFDKFFSRKIIRKYKPDKIFSLQNIVFPTDIKQILYLHQAIPFSDYKIKLIEDKKLWFYQNVISRFIFKSINKADNVIVQTEWFKKACVNKTGISEDKVSIVKPCIENDNIYQNNKSKEFYKFFYPASLSFYKNHEVIVEASRILKGKTNLNFEILFTLDEKEFQLKKHLYETYKNYNLPIVFLGTLPHLEILKMYSRTILIFPSFIETFGLPLQEAKDSGTIVLAADEPYAKEILKEYSNAYFFDKSDADKLATYMYKVLIGELISNVNIREEIIKKDSLVEKVINL